MFPHPSGHCPFLLHSHAHVAIWSCESRRAIIQPSYCTCHNCCCCCCVTRHQPPQHFTPGSSLSYYYLLATNLLKIAIIVILPNSEPPICHHIPTNFQTCHCQDLSGVLATGELLHKRHSSGIHQKQSKWSTVPESVSVL